MYLDEDDETDEKVCIEIEGNDETIDIDITEIHIVVDDDIDDVYTDDSID